MRHLAFQIYFALLAFFLTTVASFAMPPCAGSNPKYWDNCFGTNIQSNGNKYVGEFKNGKAHGYGNFTLAQDTCWGKLCYPAGGIYVGEFKNDAANGYGIATYPSGEVEEGFFKNNKFLYSAPSRLKPAFYKLTKSERLLLQRNLSKAGFYTSSIDGLYGPNTQKALSAYNDRYLRRASLKNNSNIRNLFSAVLNETSPKRSSNAGNNSSSVRQGETCIQNPALCRARELCHYATSQRSGSLSWQTTKTTTTFLKHVYEAKSRGLACGVEKKITSKQFAKTPFSELEKGSQSFIVLLFIAIAIGFYLLISKEKRPKIDEERQGNNRSRERPVQQMAQATGAGQKRPNKNSLEAIRMINTEDDLKEVLLADQLMPPDVIKTSDYGSLTFKCGCGNIHGVNDPLVQKIASFHPIKILFKCSTHYTKVRIRGFFSPKCVSEWSCQNRLVAEFNRKRGL